MTPSWSNSGLENAGDRRHIYHVHSLGDSLFSGIIATFALVILGLLAGIVAELIFRAMPSIRHVGFGFLLSTEWDPSADLYGVLPFIYATAASSALALIITAPLSLGVALCLSEMAPQWLSRKLGFLIELPAAIPSVVYGLWAICVLGPWLRDWIEPVLSDHLSYIPLFAGPRVSVGMLTAGWCWPLWCCPISPQCVLTSSEWYRRASAKLRSPSPPPNGKWSGWRCCRTAHQELSERLCSG